jgi:hypothetical protein
MEKPHMPRRISLSALAQSWSRIVPWICLLLVASTGAHGLQLAAAATLPAAANDHLDVTLHASGTTSTHTVMITGLDEITGDRMQVDCVTTTDRIAIYTLVVELKNLGDIAARLCNQTAPMLRSADPY